MEKCRIIDKPRFFEKLDISRANMPWFVPRFTKNTLRITVMRELWLRTSREKNEKSRNASSSLFHSSLIPQAS